MTSSRMIVRSLAGRCPGALLFVALTSTAYADSDAIVLYAGYGNVHGAVIEGRVIESESIAPPHADDSWWRNLMRNLRLLFNEEREGRKVTVQMAGKHWRAVTDEEGYWKVKIDAMGPLATGWQPVIARVRDQTANGALLIAPPEDRVGVISDVDDTVLVSQVTDKDRLLSNSLLKNPLQRQAVPGVAEFYRRLAERNPRPDAAPIVYLSASPRQFYTSIEAFLDLNDFPRGVLIMKKVTNDRTSEPLIDQVAYKTQKIEELLTRLPHVRFVLVGDDGEKDPEIYHDVHRRFPARVQAVWIRRVNPDPQRVRFPEQGNLAKALAGMVEPAVARRKP